MLPKSVRPLLSLPRPPPPILSTLTTCVLRLHTLYECTLQTSNGPRWRPYAGLVLLMAPCLHMVSQIRSADVKLELARTALVSVLLYVVTTKFIPSLAELTKRGGLKGKDLCKKGSPAGDIEM